MLSKNDNTAAVEISSEFVSKLHGISQTDADLTRAFVLKSHSEATRRTYRTTLQTFSRFCGKDTAEICPLLKSLFPT